MAHLVVSTDIDAPADRAWARLVDWESHGDWMLATHVRRTNDGDGVGAAIEAITSLGPFKLRDTMTFSQWQPPPANPARCVVEHTGAVVAGSGAFEVETIDEARCRVVWSEFVRLPAGLLGELAFVAVRPLAALFLRISLRRLARLVAADEAGRSVGS